VTEKAVKALHGHAYHYRIDLHDAETGAIRSLTSEELVQEAGGSDPTRIDKITRKMRWLPKYISPLVAEPLQRMIRDRITLHPDLQAIIGAFSVAHAKCVCEQVRSMFPELRVDWVGTGTDGRSPQENRAIITKFCPSAPAPGEERDRPSLDVLVHVGMAGEGLDTIYVSEVVHLNAAGFTNQNKQENGRASRYLVGATGHINFDHCSGFKKYVGDKIMDAMDDLPPPNNDDDPPTGAEPPDDPPPLPDDPFIIFNIELDHIDSGHPDVALMKRVLSDPTSKAHIAGWSLDDIKDPEHPVHLTALDEYKRMRSAEAAVFDEVNRTGAMRDQVANALSALVGLVIRRKHQPGVSVDRTEAGDLKKLINGRKARELGPIGDADFDTARRHFNWVRDLHNNILREGLPEWLR